MLRWIQVKVSHLQVSKTKTNFKLSWLTISPGQLTNSFLSFAVFETFFRSTMSIIANSTSTMTTSCVENKGGMYLAEAKHVREAFAPAIFQNPADCHYDHGGYVDCVVAKKGSSFHFYFLQGHKRSVSPVMTAQRKPLSLFKFSIYDTVFGTKERNSYLGKIKKDKQTNDFILLNGSDALQTPSQVATFVFDPVVQPITVVPRPFRSNQAFKATTTKRPLPEAVLCRGASCRDLLKTVVADAIVGLNNKKTLSTKFVQSLPGEVKETQDLVHYLLVEGAEGTDSARKKMKQLMLRGSDGKDVICITFVKASIKIQYSAPLNAFQAFGFALAAQSRF
jgi:hypothetical protein